MCEVGSQGGMDGRWHCSAAQVEILLFKHADILLIITVSFFSVAPSLHLHVLLMGQRGRGFIDAI